jgi:hypothetical protein
VYTQNTSATLEVRKIDSHFTIETSWAEQGRVKNIDTIGGSNGNNSGVSIKPIHFYQNLIHSLFTFIVAPGLPGTVLTTNSVNLIHKDDARSVLLGLAVDITHTLYYNRYYY